MINREQLNSAFTRIADMPHSFICPRGEITVYPSGHQKFTLVFSPVGSYSVEEVTEPADILLRVFDVGGGIINGSIMEQLPHPDLKVVLGS